MANVQKHPRTTVISPRNLFWKLWIWVFWILCLVISFLYKPSCKAWLKIILPKKNSMRKFRRHWTICQRVNSHKRKSILIINYNYLHLNVRSSHPELFCEKSILENFAKLTGKQLCQSLFFNKVADLRQLYSKRGFSTGAFLWILRNIYEHRVKYPVYEKSAGYVLNMFSFGLSSVRFYYLLIIF